MANNRLAVGLKGKKNLLNIYFTAGYPSLDSVRTIIMQLDHAGVDVIEVGMPYSDPMADGPTIQKTSQVALSNGMTLDYLFSALEGVRDVTQAPMLLMGYLNQMMQYGEEAFIKRAAELEIDALIIPDLPPELYEIEYRPLFEKYGVGIVFLITPQSSEERIRKIDELSDSFIYVVSQSSITGTQGAIASEQIDYFERIGRMNLKNPTMIGFGISDHDSYAKACQYSSGAIVGSAFLRHLKSAQGGSLETAISGFVEDIRKGLHSQ